MGGCVSSPKDLALNEGEAPVESPNTPKNAEGETVAQENTQEGAEKTEEPLVDLSEPKEENVEAKPEENVEAKPDEVEAEAVSETKEEPAKEKTQAEQPKAEEKSEEPLVTL